MVVESGNANHVGGMPHRRDSSRNSCRGGLEGLGERDVLEESDGWALHFDED